MTRCIWCLVIILLWEGLSAGLCQEMDDGGADLVKTVKHVIENSSNEISLTAEASPSSSGCVPINALPEHTSINSLKYITIFSVALNIIFIVSAAVIYCKFWRTRGLPIEAESPSPLTKKRPRSSSRRSKPLDPPPDYVFSITAER